jgi:hypothetical protein
MPVQSQELLIRAAPGEEALKCALFAELISRYGQARLKAMGTSMLPSIWPGDTLMVERQAISSLVAGDVAVYLRCGRLFAHRVVGVVRQPVAALITRGDAVSCDDQPVFGEELLGRVSAIVPGPRLASRIQRSIAALQSALASLLGRRRSAASLQ